MECSPLHEVDWLPGESDRGLYRKLFFSWRSGLEPGKVLPRIACVAHGVSLSSQHVAAYRSVTNASDLDSVPLLYPHALMGPAHLMIIGHPQFPLGAVGLLHLRNHVLQRRPCDIERPWDLRCELARQRYVDKGLEFDFDSTVSIEGEVVWQSVSTYLKRGRPQGEIEESPLSGLFAALPDDAVESTRFDVPGDIGKQYARVTGDYNPIHVSTLAAKLFGFKRSIAHGMWSVARALDDLPKIDGPVRHDVAFKGPMFTGSLAAMKCGENGRFDLFCGNNPRPVIVGAWRSATDGEQLASGI